MELSCVVIIVVIYVVSIIIYCLFVNVIYYCTEIVNLNLFFHERKLPKNHKHCAIPIPTLRERCPYAELFWYAGKCGPE